MRGQGGVGDMSAELARLLMGLASPLLSGAAAPGLANSGVLDKKWKLLFHRHVLFSLSLYKRASISEISTLRPPQLLADLQACRYPPLSQGYTLLSLVTQLTTFSRRCSSCH